MRIRLYYLIPTDKMKKLFTLIILNAVNLRREISINFFNRIVKTILILAIWPLLRSGVAFSAQVVIIILIITKDDLGLLYYLLYTTKCLASELEETLIYLIRSNSVELYYNIFYLYINHSVYINPRLYSYVIKYILLLRARVLIVNKVTTKLLDSWEKKMNKLALKILDFPRFFQKFRTAIDLNLLQLDPKRLNPYFMTVIKQFSIKNSNNHQRLIVLGTSLKIFGKNTWGINIRYFSTNNYNNTQSLVLWGSNLVSTVGLKIKLQDLARIKLAQYQYSIIIGLILSDGTLRLTTKNARLEFAQSTIHSEYFWFVFRSLAHYCGRNPRISKRVIAGKTYYALAFYTRSMPCITELYYLFHPKKEKIIPENIYDLLTPVALAHFVCGDGGVMHSGLRLHTNCYSVQDVVRLMNVLIIRYRLQCTIHIKRVASLQKVEYLIYIAEKSMSLLRQIITAHMCPSMLYKLNLSKENSIVASVEQREIPEQRLFENNKLRGKKVEILDTLKDESTVYSSISEAAKAIRCGRKTIILKANEVGFNKENGVSSLINKRFLVKFVETNNSMYQKVEVWDESTNETTVYSSIRETARAIGCDRKTILTAAGCNENGISRLINKRFRVNILKD